MTNFITIIPTTDRLGNNIFAIYRPYANDNARKYLIITERKKLETYSFEGASIDLFTRDEFQCIVNQLVYWLLEIDPAYLAP
jgi:hypothetical protein